MSAALRETALTALGRALGCTEDGRPATRPPARPCVPPSIGREWIRGADRELPERCYFAGSLDELGPAPPPRRPRPLSWGWMDREASELAERGRADIIRYVQLRARIARRGRKPRRQETGDRSQGAAA